MFSRSAHSAPVCGLRNVQSSKAVQSFQKSNHFLCHAPLSLQKKIRCSSLNKYFDLPCPHLYARCFQCQICGHYAWDCKRHFFQLCRYALSVSSNRLFPLRPIFYSTETACSLHAGDRSVPLIFSQSGAWEKGSFAASSADSSVRQYPV